MKKMWLFVLGILAPLASQVWAGSAQPWYVLLPHESGKGSVAFQVMQRVTSKTRQDRAVDTRVTVRTGNQSVVGVGSAGCASPVTTETDVPVRFVQLAPKAALGIGVDQCDRKIVAKALDVAADAAVNVDVAPELHKMARTARTHYENSRTFSAEVCVGIGLVGAIAILWHRDNDASFSDFVAAAMVMGAGIGAAYLTYNGFPVSAYSLPWIARCVRAIGKRRAAYVANHEHDGEISQWLTPGLDDATQKLLQQKLAH